MNALPECLPYEELYAPGCFGPLDEWLRHRLLHTLHLMEHNPTAPLSGLGVTRAERVGAYRMVVHEEVKLQRLLEPAADAVGAALRRGEAGEVALCVHDRTEAELSHLAMDGVGEVGNPICRGFFLQTALVVDEQGAAYGVLGARTWVRPESQHGKAKDRKQRPFDEKESALWWQAMEQAEARVAQVGRLLHVIDAEGDIFELLARTDAAGFQLLVRASQDRRVEGEAARMWATLESQPVSDKRTLHLSARPALKGKPARAARDACLTLRWCPLSLLPPARHQGQPLRVWGVLVREEQPPEGEKPVEWLLLTNIAVQSLEAAWGVVESYRRRWLIEELHKALKTGCRLEQRQHQRRGTLENVLAMMLQVSVRLLRLRTLSRSSPETPATEVLEPMQVQVLTLLAPRLAPRRPLSPVPTLGQALHLLAILGGYMGSSGSPPPGWLTLWRGYERLRQRVEGFLLALSLDSPPA